MHFVRRLLDENFGQVNADVGHIARGDRAPELVLTLDHQLQLAARDALGDRPGSVVALDPSTGAVRAMWSWPSKSLMNPVTR